MKSYIYSIYDKVAKNSIFITDAPNDGMLIRQQAKSIAQNIPLGDVEIRRIGEFDTESCQLISYDEPIVVSWDSYKFPESPFKKVDSKMEDSKDER